MVITYMTMVQIPYDTMPHHGETIMFKWFVKSSSLYAVDLKSLKEDKSICSQLFSAHFLVL